MVRGIYHGAMATSIRVSRKLHARLKALKERMKAKTFDGLLRRLVERPLPSRWERFGAHPDMELSRTKTGDRVTVARDR